MLTSSKRQETQRAQSIDQPIPIWPSKEKTDVCYNRSLDLILDTLAQDIQSSQLGDQPVLSLLAATHNGASAARLINGMETRGLLEFNQDGERNVVPRARNLITLAQLYGTSNKRSGV